MKKNYFLLAASTMMFAACAQTDMVNEVVTEEAPQAIGFEPFAEKVTRGLTSNKLEEYHKGGFGVWAYKSTKTNGAVMPNYNVKYENGWIYDGLTGGTDGRQNQTIKYWDKKASYEFYAYAPYSTNASINENNKVISIAVGQYAANENLQTSFSTTLNTSAFSGEGVTADKASTDWMIAADVKNYASYGTPVSEVFSHTMSKIIVRIQSTIANTNVTSVTVNNVYGSGSYSSNAGWTVNGNATNIEGATGEIETANTNYYAMEYLLIPSNYSGEGVAKPSFSIEYEISGDKYTVNDMAITDVSEFSPNTNYIVTVKIDLDAIEFTANAEPFSTPKFDPTTIE